MNLEQLLAMGLTQEQAEKIIADNKAAIEQYQALQDEVEKLRKHSETLLA